MIDYRITSKEFYTEKVGELISMLEHTRKVTLCDISDLSQSDLDYTPDESTNSIGSLLLHIASIEFVHQVVSNENRDLTESEYMEWKTALELGAKAIEDINKHSLDFYLKKLDQVRKHTLTLFKTKQDDWLAEEKAWDNGIPYNNYYLWFHVMEEEISHRGQIRLIRKLLRTDSKTQSKMVELK